MYTLFSIKEKMNGMEENHKWEFLVELQSTSEGKF
jgi:hypothetical protein